MTAKRAIRILADERGSLLLIAIVTVALTTLIGTATVVTIVSQSGGCSSVYQRLADNQPVSEEELRRCREAFPNQFRTAVAGGSLLNAADATPNLENVVAQYGSGAIGNMVDRGSSPTPPTSDAPLPPDVAAGGGPNCSTGHFVCDNGQTICAEQVCNGSSDCGDGSDESPAVDCGDQRTCCVVTSSCPGETGSSCADNCCCCPFGQVCSSNPIQGCVSASSQLSAVSSADGTGTSKLERPFLFY